MGIEVVVCRETLQRLLISARPSASSTIPTARCRSSSICLPRALSDERADRSDRFDAKERADTAEAADPIERTEHAEPIDPIERTEPTEPIESTEPSLAIERIDPDDRRDQRDEFTVGRLYWIVRARLAPSTTHPRPT
jgi:hypothetical protein